MKAEQHPQSVRPPLVSAAAAARVLGIGRTTVYELVKDGHLTPIHLRGYVRFSMYEIEQYVESLRRSA
jgi:excisionase family DNA binding protein